MLCYLLAFTVSEEDLWSSSSFLFCTCVFSSCFLSFYLSLVLGSLIVMFCYNFLHGSCAWHLLSVLNLLVYGFHKVLKICKHYFFKYFSVLILPLLLPCPVSLFSFDNSSYRYIRWFKIVPQISDGIFMLFVFFFSILFYIVSVAIYSRLLHIFFYINSHESHMVYFYLRHINSYL